MNPPTTATPTAPFDAAALLRAAPLLAALLIGFAETFGAVLFPHAAGVLVYVMMALILLWKPSGLFKAG